MQNIIKLAYQSICLLQSSRAIAISAIERGTLPASVCADRVVGAVEVGLEREEASVEDHMAVVTTIDPTRSATCANVRGTTHVTAREVVASKTESR